MPESVKLWTILFRANKNSSNDIRFMWLFEPTESDVVNYLLRLADKEKGNLDIYLRYHKRIWAIYNFGLPEFKTKWSDYIGNDEIGFFVTIDEACAKEGHELSPVI